MEAAGSSREGVVTWCIVLLRGSTAMASAAHKCSDRERGSVTTRVVTCYRQMFLFYRTSLDLFAFSAYLQTSAMDTSATVYVLDGWS